MPYLGQPPFDGPYPAGDLVVDTFSGNNSTTAFTLSKAPLSENNTFVFISGVYQDKDQYSISGVTVTFTAAPPTGTNNIQVIQGQPTIVNTPGSNTVGWSSLATDIQASQSGLIDMLHIDSDTAHRDMIADGWMPSFFNQQWGGAPHYFELVDAATGTPYKFEAATGYIEQEQTSYTAFGYDNTNCGLSQGFKVSKDQSISAIWVKIAKVGNPTVNAELRIQADSSGVPTANFTAITNGTATAIAGTKLNSGYIYGEWVRFSFATPCALTAGTQYHITLKSSGANSTSNYFTWVRHYNSGKYPHGVVATGTNVPAWTSVSSADNLFLVEASSSVESIQTGGIFSDGKLTFFEGSPLNQSNGRCKELKDFRGLDLTDCTLLVRGTAWTKDKTIMDITYGLDHDRIVLRANASTGYPQVDVYESDGTKHTVTGTTDISSGNHDIAIRLRAKNDGSDVVQLWVNGASQGTPVSSASIAFDTLFGLAQTGTAWIGGGFALAPTWSGSSISSFTGLPSTLGWTYQGTATESNAFSVSGGKLYQNKNGYTSTQTGYYQLLSSGLSNTNGTALYAKVKNTWPANIWNGGSVWLDVRDGSKQHGLSINGYFIQPYSVGYYTDGKLIPQDPYYWKNQKVALIIIKGTESYLFIDGKLTIDLLNMGTTATDAIQFGDNSNVADDNADAIWSYVKYYTTAWLPPQFTAGSLSELAFWNGDKTGILSTLYNSGSFVAVKTFCGIQKNYVGQEVEQVKTLFGATTYPTTTASSFTVLSQMEYYVIGSTISTYAEGYDYHDTVGQGVVYSQFVDGAQFGTSSGSVFDTAGRSMTTPSQGTINKIRFGLHKVETRWGNINPIGTVTNNTRSMTIKASA